MFFNSFKKNSSFKKKINKNSKKNFKRNYLYKNSNLKTYDPKLQKSIFLFFIYIYISIKSRSFIY